MAKTQIHLLLKQAMDRYEIRGKDLAAIIGIGPSHISDIRSGKKWVSPEVFVGILEGMDKLAPGARHYFCKLLAEEELVSQNSTIGDKIIELIEVADDNDMEQLLLAIGRKWKRDMNRGKQQDKNETSISTEKFTDAIAV